MAILRDEPEAQASARAIENSTVRRVSAALHSFCDRLQKVQRDFRRTIETSGHDGTTYSDGSVSTHVAIGPRARAHVMGENRIQGDRDTARKADLLPMGVSAQQQTEIGIGRLLQLQDVAWRATIRVARAGARKCPVPGTPQPQRK